MEAHLNISNMRAQFGSVQGFMGVTYVFSNPSPALSLFEDGFPKFFFRSYFMTWSASRSIRARKRPILPSLKRHWKKPTSFSGIFPLKNGGKRVPMIAWETSLFHGCTHTNTSYTQREICNHVWKGKNSSKVLNFNKKWRKTTKGTYRSIFWRRRSKSTRR